MISYVVLLTLRTFVFVLETKQSALKIGSIFLAVLFFPFLVIWTILGNIWYEEI